MTEYKQIEEVVKECEGKFLKLFRESPLVLALTSARDDRYIEVNDTFERRTGWNRDEVIGRTPYDLKVLVDPGQRVDLVKQLLSGGTVRNLELQGRMKNGEVRTGSASAALIDINGETCVLILIEDTTDLKRAEEAKQVAERLSIALHRLIQAQEEERTSIARVLHTYIDCLALLSIGLDRLRQNPPQSVAEARHEIEKARQQVKDLLTDIQTLSHHLHSSTLEYLGLTAAASSLCKEYSDQRKLEINFVSEGIPKEMPEEISLCLYRVLQEALQNATEHSGSRLCEVRLNGELDGIRLTVSDWGVGFDPVAALKENALGITYMKERLKLVDGELSIESQSERGTTIRASVPLRQSAKSAEAS